MSKVDFFEREHFERGAGKPDGWLDVFFEEFFHVHPEERPGLLQHLGAWQRTEHVRTACFHAFIKQQLSFSLIH